MGPADRDDFESFVRQSGATLLHTAWLLTQDRGHAEDIVQDSLAKVARRWEHVCSSPEAYARRTVVHAAIDTRRRQRARPRETAMGHFPGHLPAGEGTVDLRLALLGGLRALPPRQRAVLVLRYVLDLDEAQTAEALGITLGTVKSTAHRGLAAMRRLAPSLALTESRPETP